MWRRTNNDSKSSSLPLPLALWRCCCFAAVCSLATAASASAAELGKRQLSPALGLSQNNLDKNGIAMGKELFSFLGHTMAAVQVV